MDSGRFGGYGGGHQGGRGLESPSGRSAGSDAPRKSRPLRPVTIHQLLAAQRVGDGALVVDGHEIGQVTIVGVVLQVEVADVNAGTTQHSYRVCDGTGVITVRTWTSDRPAELNTYIRASGNVGSHQNNLSITGMVRPVSNSSEVPYHQMDCALTHLRLTQGTRTAGYGVPSQAQQGGHQPQQQHQGMGMHAPYGAPQQQQQQVYGIAPPQQAMSPQAFGNPREIILSAIRSAGPAGATVQGISESVRPYGLQGEVRDIIRSLNAEGTVYTQNNTIYLSNHK